MADDSPGKELRLALTMSASGVIGGILAGANPVESLASGLAPVAVQAAVAIRTHWVNKSTRSIEVAADRMGVGVDIVLERSLAYEDRLELLARVIEASARSTIPEKVEALGKVLADGLQEDGDTAEALILARALEALDGPHVVVLDHLERIRLPPPELLDVRHIGVTGWQVPVIAQALPDLADVMEPLVATLSGTGLLRDNTGVNYSSQPGPEAWVITPTGSRCLFLLDSDEPS
ncbi:hypothetical protein O2W15_07550 [Modestobacter sp. VKM Ac-2979]|uniref:hypothetical protein n=1 Tax=unclassified Modestobacter TaxID=2643866 RepID=UPI0022AB9B8A|nr:MULTISPECIES: hypothetical protein [unclassified Modestobacter]MCZ2811292.1 hypothetical protein [Modestobacter sp. VKM Ac-2979]MCZ2840805.1 hypothetical protein [Modestobacter sp. VKM Ac-2980]